MGRNSKEMMCTLKRYLFIWKDPFSAEKPIFRPEKPTFQLKRGLSSSILSFRNRLLKDYVLGFARLPRVHYCNILNRHKHKIFSVVENSGRLLCLSNFLGLWQNLKSSKIHTNKQMMDQSSASRSVFFYLFHPYKYKLPNMNTQHIPWYLMMIGEQTIMVNASQPIIKHP